jgi:hypothetical protein
MLPEVRSPSSEVCGQSCGVNTFGSQRHPHRRHRRRSASRAVRPGLFQPGMAKNTYGTGCFMLHEHRPRRCLSQNQLLTTVAWKNRRNSSTPSKAASSSPARSCNGCATASASSAPRRKSSAGRHRSRQRRRLFRPRLRRPRRAALGPVRPRIHSRHHARHHRRSPRPRSAGASPSRVADLLDAMERDSALPLRELRVDGGAAVNDFLMQFQADLLRSRSSAAHGRDHRPRRWPASRRRQPPPASPIDGTVSRSKSWASDWAFSNCISSGQGDPPSKLKPHSKLKVPRQVSSRVGGNSAKRGSLKSRVRLGKPRMVRRIEDLRPQFNVRAFLGHERLVEI